MLRRNRQWRALRRCATVVWVAFLPALPAFVTGCGAFSEEFEAGFARSTGKNLSDVLFGAIGLGLAGAAVEQEVASLPSDAFALVNDAEAQIDAVVQDTQAGLAEFGREVQDLFQGVGNDLGDDLGDLENLLESDADALVDSILGELSAIGDPAELDAAAHWLAEQFNSFVNEVESEIRTTIDSLEAAGNSVAKEVREGAAELVDALEADVAALVNDLEARIAVDGAAGIQIDELVDWVDDVAADLEDRFQEAAARNAQFEDGVRGLVDRFEGDVAALIEGLEQGIDPGSLDLEDDVEQLID